MRATSVILSAIVLSACGLPRDPQDTLKRVQGGTLRVGIAEHRPWTSDSAGAYGGVEADMVRELARELGAKVEWRVGGESVLLPGLHERKLDLVVAGLDAKTPWSKSVGITKPYHAVFDPKKRELVWAVAPGENAWQIRVERFLLDQKPRLGAMHLQSVSASAQ
jgi:polar amino acid transport system substrate-binding protein